MHDNIFLNPAKRKHDFDFGKDVARVFDDMLKRSVPFYFEMQNMIADLANEYVIEGTNIYDLGCSTGTTLNIISKRVKGKKYSLVGLDYSQEMLSKADEKLKAAGVENYSLEQADLNEHIQLENASVVIMTLTMQFVRPLQRKILADNIYKSLKNNGCLIMVEKVLCRDSRLNRSFIDLYYQFKQRNDYSKTEIAAKRESLENVLIPYRLEENIELLRRDAFEIVEPFFRWFNFAGIIAVKNKSESKQY